MKCGMQNVVIHRHVLLTYEVLFNIYSCKQQLSDITVVLAPCHIHSFSLHFTDLFEFCKKRGSMSHLAARFDNSHRLFDENIFSLLFAVDQNIRLYDTTRGRFSLRRTVKARDVGWSVLDVCFTPDAQNVLYSSWSDYSKADAPVRYNTMQEANHAN